LADPVELPALIVARLALDIAVAQAVSVALADPVSLTALARHAGAPVVTAVARSAAHDVRVNSREPVSAISEMAVDLPLTVRGIRGGAPTRLARVEPAMPRIMIDHRGAVYHL
jgi:hypothetical protein